MNPNQQALLKGLLYIFGGSGFFLLINFLHVFANKNGIETSIYYNSIQQDTIIASTAIIYFMSVPLNLVGALVIMKNPRFVLPIKMLLMTDSLATALLSFIISYNFSCHLDQESPSFPSFPCWFPPELDIPNMYGAFLAKTQLYTRFTLSLSRFFAISFDGLYFKQTLKLPFVQLAVAGLAVPLIDFYLISKFIDRQSSGHSIAPEKMTTFFGSAMLAIDVIVFLNMRNRQQTDNSTKSRAETKLAIQMLGNSTVFLGENFFQILGLIVIYLNFQKYYIYIWYSSTVLRAVFFVFSGILTVIFIRGSSTEKTIEITHVSSTDSSKSSTNVSSPRRESTRR